MVIAPSAATFTAPDRYAVELATTRGDLVLDVERALAPIGADRFYNLVRIGYLQRIAFFRVVEGFMAQAGIHGDPATSKLWRDARIKDDPPRTANVAGTVSFATSGPNARSVQFFINLGDNRRLDAMGFAPFGRVRSLDVVRQLHSGYGDAPPGGRGPMQGRLQREGNAYLEAEFPDLDYIERARLLEDGDAG